MKKFRIFFIALGLTAVAMVQTGCFGSFKLTQAVYQWNSSIEDKTVRSMVFFALCAIPVYEAAVVGVADDKWQERPLALVVVHPGTDVDIDQLRSFLADKVAKWWIPERWSFVSDIPRTSVGKYDKKVIRARHSAGEYLIEIETS